MGLVADEAVGDAVGLFADGAPPGSYRFAEFSEPSASAVFREGGPGFEVLVRGLGRPLLNPG